MLDASLDVRLADLVRSFPTLHPGDSLSKALHQLRLTSAIALPVVAGGLLQGVVAEVDLLEAVQRSGWALDPSAQSLEEVPVSAIMTREVTVGRADQTLASAWETMETARLKLLPVLDVGERYLGVVSRPDLFAALHRDLRPRTVGGLATPLGVYLTTGHHRAGAGDLGLFLTGVVMALCHLVVVTGLEGFDRFAGWVYPDWVAALLQFCCFLMLLRLTPLAGFHAAEHQVVHAIEKGERLALEVLARQPREHPRCGTNLVALLFGAQFLFPLANQPTVGMLSAIFLFFAWRRMGWVLQRFFTTKPARPHQLRSARAAGKDLLEAFGARPALRAGRLKRIWLTGFVQMVAGFGAVLGVVQCLNLLLQRLGMPA